MSAPTRTEKALYREMDRTAPAITAHEAAKRMKRQLVIAAIARTVDGEWLAPLLEDIEMVLAFTRDQQAVGQATCAVLDLTAQRERANGRGNGR